MKNIYQISGFILIAFVLSACSDLFSQDNPALAEQKRNLVQLEKEVKALETDYQAALSEYEMLNESLQKTNSQISVIRREIQIDEERQRALKHELSAVKKN